VDVDGDKELGIRWRAKAAQLDLHAYLPIAAWPENQEEIHPVRGWVPVEL
jgi:hypothetical protein